MNDVAMAGDMALVTGLSEAPKTNGMIVRVLSNPYFAAFPSESRIFPPQWINEVDGHACIEGTIAVVPTRCLIPLRGNPDALTWTTETGRSVKA